VHLPACHHDIADADSGTNDNAQTVSSAQLPQPVTVTAFVRIECRGSSMCEGRTRGHSVGKDRSLRTTILHCVADERRLATTGISEIGRLSVRSAA
jgi:hypothetical protein